MASSDKLAEIKQRYRDDPNTYWVSEVDWLLGEVERLRDERDEAEARAHQWCEAANRQVAEIRRLREALCEIRAMVDRLREALCEIRAMVDKQADDEGLWFLRVTASEAYLQRKLRSLHAKIERLTARHP